MQSAADQKRFPSGIPVIDISGFIAQSAREKARVAAELREACIDIGFFFVVGHGVPRAVVDGAFDAARSFFAQPLDAKMAISMERHSRCFRGYSPIFSELADGKRNWYEIVEFGVDLPPDHPDVAAGKPMHGPNLWPPAIPSYRPRIEDYTSHLRSLGFVLMRAMALSLDLPEDYFTERFFDDPHWVFRTAHYPAREAVLSGGAGRDRAFPDLDGVEIGDFSCSPHTDYGFLTILTADDEGLEVRMRDGSWIAVPPLEDAFICNIGDTVQLWTDGFYVATPHRVQTTASRISLPFFFQPNYETVIEPLGRPGGTGGPCRTAMKYGPYSFEKYKAIYPACAVP
jgi:isopenicillin N synthase-like dioxygenase